MTVRVSDKLRESLERLDQAIDRLEFEVESLRQGAEATSGEACGADDNSANALIAERLDRIIEQVELALAD